MKSLPLKIIISIFLFELISCSQNSEVKINDSENKQEIQVSPDTLIKLDTIPKKEIQPNETISNEILPDGKYRFDIAFAEWQGQSMGEKVTVIIKGGSIKIIYEGDGQLTNTGKGEVMEEGLILKHKSGSWIIANSPLDAELNEVGGCTGGPSIIDFKEKKYWIC